MDSMERSSDGANMGGGDVDTHQVVEHSRKNPVVLAWTPEEEAYERTHQVSAVTSVARGRGARGAGDRSGADDAGNAE